MQSGRWQRTIIIEPTNKWRQRRKGGPIWRGRNTRRGQQVTKTLSRCSFGSALGSSLLSRMSTGKRNTSCINKKSKWSRKKKLRGVIFTDSCPIFHPVSINYRKRMKPTLNSSFKIPYRTDGKRFRVPPHTEVRL